MTPPAAEATSPAMHPYQGILSEEEIHDILGAMHDSTNGDHEESTSNHSGASHPGPTSEARAQARSERKRSREKQRREDVNKQFADLSALLRQIEEEEDQNSKRLPYSTTNRVDLIARTIVLMERVHNVSKERKQEIANLQKELEDARKMAEDTAARLKEATLYQQPGPQKQVMMMVPMMVNPEAMGPGGAFMAPQPYMQPQMMIMPQIPQSGSNGASGTPPQQIQTQPQQQGQGQQVQSQQMQPQQHAHQMQPHQMQSQPMQQQQMHPMHGQMHMMPQMMPQFSTMMFQQPTQVSPLATGVASVASSPQQAGQHVQQGQKVPAASNNNANGGGNLAHCA